jgi:hypothetical protein
MRQKINPNANQNSRRPSAPVYVLFEKELGGYRIRHQR